MPLNFTLDNVTNEPTQLLATWSTPNPTNGIITGYTVTCLRSTQQVSIKT